MVAAELSQDVLKLIAITGLAGGTYPLLSIMDRGFRREEVGVSAEEFVC